MRQEEQTQKAKWASKRGRAKGRGGVFCGDILVGEGSEMG